MARPRPPLRCTARIARHSRARNARTSRAPTAACRWFGKRRSRRPDFPHGGRRQSGGANSYRSRSCPTSSCLTLSSPILSSPTVSHRAISNLPCSRPPHSRRTHSRRTRTGLARTAVARAAPERSRGTGPAMATSSPATFRTTMVHPHHPQPPFSTAALPSRLPPLPPQPPSRHSHRHRRHRRRNRRPHPHAVSPASPPALLRLSTSLAPRRPRPSILPGTRQSAPSEPRSVDKPAGQGDRPRLW